MIVTIHQPQYMPWIGYFHKISTADLFVVLDDVQFKKNEWQHRNRIRNAEGTQWLSVPNRFHFPEKINEVKIRYDEPWQEKHLRSLEACYGKAKFYPLYVDELRSFYRDSPETIDRVNLGSIQLLNRLMGIETPIELSSRHQFPGSSTERLIHICKHFGAKTYLAGAGAFHYMDFDAFKSAGIEVRVQEFACPVYPQRWAKSENDFIPNLSALDLLFNCGPQSLELIRTQAPKVSS